jgi:hypothetical protein
MRGPIVQMAAHSDDLSINIGVKEPTKKRENSY